MNEQKLIGAILKYVRLIKWGYMINENENEADNEKQIT